ncbi:hypothetical protein H0H92_009746 [Tricholoma furcatifolium]|nr:hypothetical protein H0H92_009746 [Tricholoma furcatifolium]
MRFCFTMELHASSQLERPEGRAAPERHQNADSLDRDASSGSSLWKDRPPIEILAYIFTSAFNSEKSDDADAKGLVFPIRLSQIPWVVSRVCGRWRDIARGEIHLWSDVTLIATVAENDLDPDEMFRVIPPMSSSRIRMLRRYGDSKLTLEWEIFQGMKFLRRLQFSNPGAESHTLGGDIALNRFIPYGQLKHLDLREMTFTNPHKLVSLIQLCQNVTSFCYPSLVSSHHGDLEVSEDKGLLPCLKSAITKDRAALSLISPPWLQLSTLTLRCAISSAETLTILAKTSRLESFTISEHAGHFVHDQPFIIPLIHLRVIHIPPSMAHVLKFLVAPEIRELCIGGKSRQNIGILPLDDFLSIFNFLDQGPHLESFTLDMGCDDQYIPQIRTIVLTDLQSLYISSRDKWLLGHLVAPRLRIMSIRLVPGPFDDGIEEHQEHTHQVAVLNFLESASNLGAVVIQYKGPDTTGIIKLAQPLSVSQEEDRWIVSHLAEYFIDLDTHFPEEEYRDFIARSACALPRLELVVEWYGP